MADNNSSLTSSASMTYFNLLKSFQVTIHPLEAPIIKEVIRQPPYTVWSKGSCDEVIASSSSGHGDIFRESKGNFILVFAEQTLIANSLHDKFSVVLHAIELARDKECLKLWIQSDSLLVVQTFSKDSLVP